MKTPKMILRTLTLAILLFNNYSSFSQDTIAAWTFPTGDYLIDLNANAGLSVNLSYDLRADDTLGNLRTITMTSGVSSYAASSEGWDNGANFKYWTVKFKADGHYNFKISSRQSSGSVPGPKFWKIQAKLAGGIWEDIPGGNVTCSDDWSSGIVSSLHLPSNYNNPGTTSIYIRWIPTSDSSTANTIVGSTGINLIDDIIITDSYMADAGTDINIICGGSAQLNATTNYTGTDNIYYSWAPSTGLSNTTISNPIATVTSDMKYFVTVTFPDNYIVIDSVMVHVNPLTANAGSNKTIICGGSAQLDNVTSNYTGSGTLSYLWSPITGLSGSNISNPVSTITSSMTYTVTVTTDNGCTAADDVTVQVNPLIINSPNVSSLCGSPVEINTTNNYTGTGQLTYSWQPTLGLSDSGISNPEALPINSTTYTVTVTTPNGCTATGSSTVTINSLQSDEICVVTVDTTTWKNKIMWEKSNSNVIDNYYIYKEVAANVYNYIGTVDYSSDSYYIDYTSVPESHGDKYKISTIDTCFHESSKSYFHKPDQFN